MSNPFNPRFPSPASHDFANVARIETKRSAFKANPRYTLMFDEGKLIPLPPVEVIPGDTFTFDFNMLCRLNTPIVPFMSGLNLHSYHFFVPYRILWEHWVNFQGEKVNPSDSTVYTVPVVTAPSGGFAVESVYDYMGIPIGKQKNVSALQLRAYAEIYNKYFRDQNLINSIATPLGDGPDADTLYTIRRVAKYHDYFTSCLKAPQYGAAQSFSLTGQAPVIGLGKETQDWTAGTQAVYEAGGSGSVNYTSYRQIDPSVASYRWYAEEDADNTGFPNVKADLQNVGGITIAEFRETLMLQALAEIENRGGHRYVEILYSVYNVVSPDFRLQDPEYLGGSKTPLYVVPVAQTSASETGKPQGDLAAYGSAFKTNDGFTKSFTEHGCVITLVCVRSDGSNTYSQGLHRQWTRTTKYDFFNPYLQNIGDQAVLQQEIFLSDNNPTDDAIVFGYQERYAEYMYMPSYVLGKLRPAYATPYDYWHLSPEYGSAPTLSQTFIEEDAPVDRVVAVTTEPDFVMDVSLDATLTRPMALHSIPGMLTRF